jgi:curli production assembly/transport component CsgG/holdfast attachment protein HfaB
MLALKPRGFACLTGKPIAAVCAACLALAGCVSPVAGPNGNYAHQIGDAPVTDNPTPYSAALVCLARYAQHYHVRAPRIAVGRINDYTGKAEDNGGRLITQGASLMAMSALAKAGAPMVERYDTSVSELELKYANNKLIADEPAGSPNPTGSQAAGAYRKILAGQVPGSDFYLIGGITEMNYNIRSSGLNAQGGHQNSTAGTGVVTGQLYIMNVALDVRLVETKTLEVVDVVSYQKQIIGRQVGLGLYSFFGSDVIDVSAGEGGLEPIQMAVRAMIERASVEIMANLYGAPGPSACINPANDPYAPTSTTGLTGGFYPAYNNLDQNNANTRDKPNRWNSDRDKSAAALRDRY